MKEKKGGFLRWPWNAAVYIALLAVFRLFAVPIILILMAVQRKNNPHGVEAIASAGLEGGSAGCCGDFCGLLPPPGCFTCFT